MTRGIKKTHDVFIEELKTVTNSILVLGRYEKNINPIHCKCLKCGYEWDPTPKSLLKGCGCPQCAGMKKLTHKEFLDKLSEVNPNFELIEVVSMYEGMGKKVICKCKVCGTVWTPKANDLIRKKTGCPSCSGNVFFTHDRFVKELNLKNPCASKILLLSSYNGMQQHIKCKCKDCGHEWNPVASSLIQGTGCPACAKTRVAEQAREVLMRIDRPKPHSHNWFVSKFTKKSIHAQTIEIISDYQGMNNQIACRCKVCGHEWSTIAASLMNGSGCPICSHTSTSFMEQFVYFALCKVYGNGNVLNRDTTTINRELDVYIPSEAFAIEIGSWNWHKNIIEKDLKKLELCKTKRIKMIIVYDSFRDEPIMNDDIWTYSIDLRSEKTHKTLKSIVDRCLQLLNKNISFSNADWNEVTKKAHLASHRVNHNEFMENLNQRILLMR